MAFADGSGSPLDLKVDLLPLLQPASHLGSVEPVADGVRVGGGAQAGAWAALARFAIPGPLRIRVRADGGAGALSVAGLAKGGGLIGQAVLNPAGTLDAVIEVADGSACEGVLFSSVSSDVAPAFTLSCLSLEAGGYRRFPMAEVLARRLAFMQAQRPVLEAALVQLDVQDRFSLPQALTLAAVVNDFEPSLVLDFGTCTGGSSVSMATANPGVPVHTFDIETFWESYVLQHMPAPPANVTPVVGDLTTLDFTPLLAPAERVMIFWDAHGFEIAGRMFSHILPLIAEKPHLVISHDISDNRFNAADEHRSYGGRMMFRGYSHYDANMGATARANLGWMTTAVDQGIALADFAWRNRIELSSVDHALKIEAAPELRNPMRDGLYGGEWPIFDLTYFTMNQTYLRNFPSR